MWALCVLCNKHKALWKFSNNKRSVLGIQPYCKICSSLINSRYRKDNVQRRTQYRKQYNVKHKIKNNEYSREYHIKNKVNINERQRIYRKSNMDRDAAKSAKRRFTKLKQTPDLNASEMYRIGLLYRWADILGSNFQIDHVVPLSMGGLHHPDNMHIIPRIQNLRKKDRDPKEFYGIHYDFIINGKLPYQI